MSKQSYLFYLACRRAAVEDDIRKASFRLHHGEPRQRVHAAGDLAVLERRHAALENKITAIRAAAPDSYATLRTEIAEDLDAIGAQFEHLMTGV
jgi:hypothetical protein